MVLLAPPSPPQPATSDDPAVLRTLAEPAGVPNQFTLFPARAFLAFGWLRAGVEKLIDPSWWSGDYLTGFLADHDASMLAFMQPLVDTLVRPAPIVTAVLIVAIQCVLGVCLLTGKRLPEALVGASVLNVIFVLLGAVTPSAFYLVLQVTLLLAYTARLEPIPRATRIATAAASGLAAVALTPFITTLHPAEVIDDPAIMLATLALLVGAAQLLCLVQDHIRAVSLERADYRQRREPSPAASIPAVRQPT